MTYRVRMLAYGEPGEIREVDVLRDSDSPRPADAILDDVFHYGQNELQPDVHPSVSVGDVIELGDELYVVRPLGFAQISEEDFRTLEALDRRDRHFHPLVRGD